MRRGTKDEVPCLRKGGLSRDLAKPSTVQNQPTVQDPLISHLCPSAQTAEIRTGNRLPCGTGGKCSTAELHPQLHVHSGEEKRRKLKPQPPAWGWAGLRSGAQSPHWVAATVVRPCRYDQTLNRTLCEFTSVWVLLVHCEVTAREWAFVLSDISVFS